MSAIWSGRPQLSGSSVRIPPIDMFVLSGDLTSQPSSADNSVITHPHIDTQVQFIGHTRPLVVIIENTLNLDRVQVE